MATTDTFPMKQCDDNLKRMPESIGTLGDKVKDAAGLVAETAKDAVSSVGRQTERATQAVGSGMESLGHTLREKMPHKGALGAATASVADRLESGGKYLEGEGLKGIADDVTNLIRRNPFPSLLIGVALGYAIARLTSRS